MATFPRDELEHGANLGKYEVLRRIAIGGMAEIYLARMRGAAGFEKLVVLKRILPHVASDEKLVAMFLDEARLAAQLRHANIGDVFDVGHVDGSYFFAMEYVHGQDVRTILREARAASQRIPLEISLAIVLGTAAALGYAHDVRGPRGPLGLVHRDVSPSNILVSYDGAVKLVDFGIARATNRTLNVTHTGTLRGKIPYMSPEQCQGAPLDRRSDLFSLGTVLYELTVGKRPFTGESEFAVMEHITNRRPPPPVLVAKGYPPDLEQLVLKLLAREPEARYQTAHDVIVDLEQLVARRELSTTSFAVGSYMRTLFAEDIATSEAAARRGASLAEHLAHAPERKRRTGTRPGTPATDRAPRRRDATTDRALRVVDPSRVTSREVPGVASTFAVDPLTSEHELAAFADDDPHEPDDTVADRVLPFDPVDAIRPEVEDELDTLDTANAPGGTSRFRKLVDSAAVSLAMRDIDKAVVTAEIAMSEIDDEVARTLDTHDGDTLAACFDAYLGKRSRTVAVARQLEDLASLPLGPRAAFLLSRIDGLVSIDDVIDMSSMPRLQACRHLCQLLMLGILR